MNNPPQIVLEFRSQGLPFLWPLVAQPKVDPREFGSGSNFQK
jgi:hypothetical protein